MAAWTALRANTRPRAPDDRERRQDPEQDRLAGAGHEVTSASSVGRVCCLDVLPLGVGRRGDLAEVVVALLEAVGHRERRREHALLQRGEQLVLGVDQVGAVVVGELVEVGHRQRAGRARLDAQPAEDAAQVVDLVDAAVALTGAEPTGAALGVVVVRRPRRGSRRPGRPRRTARSRCTSRARRGAG